MRICTLPLASTYLAIYSHACFPPIKTLQLECLVRTAFDSMPRLAKQMPRRLPFVPSHTAIITPAVSTSRDVNSARVGTLFSTATASTAVATGMPDLHIDVKSAGFARLA